MVCCFFVLFLTSSDAAEPEKSSEKFAGQKILAEFTFARGAEDILLPVKFKGKEHLFVLDTGASHTIFDISFKQELGKAKRVGIGKTAGSPMVAELFDAPEAFLGPLSIQDCQEVACMDLKMPSLICGKEIRGFIGMNFLKKYVIQIDFDKGKLSFLNPMSHQNSDRGEEFAINYNSFGLPHITGYILDGIRVDYSIDFIIDTGSNITGGLESKIFREILAKKKLKTSEALVETASGTVRSRCIRISDISVGPLDYEGLIFGESNCFNLGLPFWARHLVTFDFPNNKTYLKAGKDFKKTDEEGMSGLALLRISNETVVHSVDNDSPAETAGIRAGDIILKVEHKNANEYDMWKLRRLMRSEDKRKITMTIRQGNDVKEVSFLLKKKI